MAQRPVPRRGTPNPSRRAAGELETEVLGALWAAGKPLTPSVVVPLKVALVVIVTV